VLNFLTLAGRQTSNPGKVFSPLRVPIQGYHLVWRTLLLLHVVSYAKQAG
jgi:hypothetical protein